MCVRACPRGRKLRAHAFAYVSLRAHAHVRARNINFQNMGSLHLYGRYENAYIRKATALYLIQENCQVSMIGYCVLGETNRSICFLYQKLIVVWIHQSVLGIFVYSNVSIEKNKHLLGRVIHFSYLSGSKRDSQYTSTYVDMTKERFKTIGALFRFIPRGPSSSFFAVRKLFSI